MARQCVKTLLFPDLLHNSGEVPKKCQVTKIRVIKHNGWNATALRGNVRHERGGGKRKQEREGRKVGFPQLENKGGKTDS